MQVDVVSPEKMLASIEADAVMLPGRDGDFTAMEGHVPVATSLRPGFVTVVNKGAEEHFLVSGGFAEVSGEAVSILAEYAAKRDDATREQFEATLKAVEEAMEKAPRDGRAEFERDVDALKKIIDGLPQG